MPARFSDQVAIAGELLREVERMERGERDAARRASLGQYERELRLGGLAQRIAQGYTLIEGILAFVARRIDREPVSGEDWHRQLILRVAQPFSDPARKAVITAPLADELIELCAFRHVVRNVYPARLDETRVGENLLLFARAARAFDAEIRAFARSRHPARRGGRKGGRQED